MYAVVLCIIFILASSATASATDPQKAVSDFEKIVENVKSGLPSKMMLSGVEHTGYSVSLFVSVEVSYDVQETRSLVSPYRGLINIKGMRRDNRTTPETPPFYGNHSSKSAALSATNPVDFGQPKPMANFIVRYAYQKDQWVLLEPEKKDGWEYYLKTLPENEKLLDLFHH